MTRCQRSNGVERGPSVLDKTAVIALFLEKAIFMNKDLNLASSLCVNAMAEKAEEKHTRPSGFS